MTLTMAKAFAHQVGYPEVIDFDEYHQHWARATHKDAPTRERERMRYEFADGSAIVSNVYGDAWDFGVHRDHLDEDDPVSEPMSFVWATTFSEPA